MTYFAASTNNETKTEDRRSSLGLRSGVGSGPSISYECSIMAHFTDLSQMIDSEESSSPQDDLSNSISNLRVSRSQVELFENKTIEKHLTTGRIQRTMSVTNTSKDTAKMRSYLSFGSAASSLSQTSEERCRKNEGFYASNDNDTDINKRRKTAASAAGRAMLRR